MLPTQCLLARRPTKLYRQHAVIPAHICIPSAHCRGGGGCAHCETTGCLRGSSTQDPRDSFRSPCPVASDSARQCQSCISIACPVKKCIPFPCPPEPISWTTAGIACCAPAVRLGSHLPTHVALEPHFISLALCLQTAFRYRTEIALHPDLVQELGPGNLFEGPGAWLAPQAVPGLPSICAMRKAAHWASERPVSRALHESSRACQTLFTRLACSSSPARV